MKQPSGDDWERLVLRLVRERHGAENVQPIPARTHGDAGLECIAIDKGVGYQAYAPEQNRVQARTTEKIKAKASADLAKIIKYADLIEKILGRKRLSRWILVVPTLDDKSIVSFLRSHPIVDEVRNLPFVDDDFDALVQDLSFFEPEHEKVKMSALGDTLTLEAPTDQEVANYEKLLPDKIRSKFLKCYGSKKHSDGARKHISNYLRHQNAIDSLKLRHPLNWERLTITISQAESDLAIYGSDASIPSSILREHLSKLEDKIAPDLINLQPTAATTIASGIVSTWIIECPLDFEDAS